MKIKKGKSIHKQILNSLPEDLKIELMQSHSDYDEQPAKRIIAHIVQWYIDNEKEFNRHKILSHWTSIKYTICPNRIPFFVNDIYQSN